MTVSYGLHQISIASFELKTSKSIHVINLNTSISEWLKVNLAIGLKSWILWIDNEYLAYDPKKTLLNMFLVIRSLEDYMEANDYLEWCKQNNLDAANLDWLKYFNELSNIYSEIEKESGVIDSYINSLDYQMNQPRPKGRGIYGQ